MYATLSQFAAPIASFAMPYLMSAVGTIGRELVSTTKNFVVNKASNWLGEHVRPVVSNIVDNVAGGIGRKIKRLLPGQNGSQTNASLKRSYMASLADAIPLDSQPTKKRYTNPPAFPEPENDEDNGGTISMNSIQY